MIVKMIVIVTSVSFYPASPHSPEQLGLRVQGRPATSLSIVLFGAG